MRKNTVSRSKKAAPVKEEQKISAFFTKLAVTKSHGVTSSNKACFDDNLNDFKEATTSHSTAKSSITVKKTAKKTSPKKQSKSGPRNKSPVKANKTAATTIKDVTAKTPVDVDKASNSSDSDFAPVKKDKRSDNLSAFKSKYKFIYDKVPGSSQDCIKKGVRIKVVNKNMCLSAGTVIGVELHSENAEELPKDKSVKPNTNIDSHLIIEINDDQDIPVKISPQNARKFGVPLEETHLQHDEILSDITTTTNMAKQPFESHKIQPAIASSSQASVDKKRKYEVTSPDIIPPSPVEQVREKKVIRKAKSKLCMENKFSKSVHPLLFGKYNASEHLVPDVDRKLSPPNKLRKLEHANVVKNMNALITEEFGSSIVANKQLVQTCNNGPKKHEALPKYRENDIENVVPTISDDDSDGFIKRNPFSSPTKCRLADNVVKSTSKFVVSPAKNVTPSKNSPRKGTVLKASVSPSKSSPKTRRSLFNVSEDSGQSRIEEKTDAVLLKNKSQMALMNSLCSGNVTKCVESEIFKLTRNSMSPKKTSVEESMDDFNDLNFDDGWDEEINNIEEKLEQLNLDTWQYCKVLEVTNDLHHNVVLKLQSLESNLETHCLLQGIWQSTRLKTGDTVNIKASKTADQIPFTVNNNVGYVIFEPDTMISPTSIVGAQFCKRRGILNDRFRGFDPENKVMLVGTLVHTLLENVLKKKIYTSSLIERKLTKLLSSKEVIYKSYSGQIPIEEIKNELLPFVPKMVAFINKYVTSERKMKRTDYKCAKGQSDDWNGSIMAVQDIEENIWCPQLGLKGKVDVTIKTKPEGAILPLELKTGRASMSLEHRGQLIMYSMIMTELGYEVNSGLLLYLREDTIKEVTASHREKRDLMMLRNEVAYYLKQTPTLPILVPNSDIASSGNNSASSTSSNTVLSEHDPIQPLVTAELPEPINHHNACKKCPYATICTAFLSRDTSCSISDNHPLKALAPELTSHLEPAHIDYFLHWTSLITIENNYKPPMKELKDIWRLQPYERERRGKSVAYLKLGEPVKEENDDMYLHVFIRSVDENVSRILIDKNLKSNFLASGLAIGNYVVISTDGRVALATGFVSQLTQDQIGINLERNLSQRYASKLFHIDTYESQTIWNFAMTSTASLLDHSDRAKRLRLLIIDKKPSIITGKLTRNIKTVGERILKRLNKVQQRAVLQALTTTDYMLIKGMPGTGKTATVVALIELLVKLDKTVLITSHTHSAVDNVCLRLLDAGVEILRLGSATRVHPQLRHRTEAALTIHCKTADELKEVYDNARVVAVTCLAAAHPMFAYRSLDVCIVDESTQVVQCSVFKALLSAASFILIGDPDQLPPIVRNPEAVRRGMGQSLFERLDNPASTVTLTLQYRMNKVITDLANAVTYQGQLCCANDSIGNATILLPNLERLLSAYSQEQWILRALDPKIEHSVTAIDTGPTWNMSTANASAETEHLLTEIQVAPQNVHEDEERRCSNICEAGVVMSLIVALQQAGVQLSDIGVIAPYRAQVMLLKKAVSALGNPECSDIEVNTVDQYQGRDKNIILYTCTRSRDTAKTKTNIGYEILEDKRRLTVAITRAKRKLIIIGDFSTLKKYTPFNKLLTSLRMYQKFQLGMKIDGFMWQRVLDRIKKATR